MSLCATAIRSGRPSPWSSSRLRSTAIEVRAGIEDQRVLGDTARERRPHPVGEGPRDVVRDVVVAIGVLEPLLGVCD